MAQLVASGGEIGLMPPMLMQFPPFQIEEDDYNAGVIEVIAKSPSGKTVPLNISKDQAGQFTTNFIPNEIGDWLISITSNHRQIRGSPFTVRVYDGSKVKVYGIQGGDNGLPVSFTVDTSKAGDGKLKVTVKKDGRNVAATVKQRGRKYDVTFNPDGPGVYLINVFYAAVEVPGSPFKVTIVDSSNVTASGEGLVSSLVGRSTFFNVNTTKAEMTSGEVTVAITSPSGASVEQLARHSGAGIYNISYVPEEVGRYAIEVKYGGKSISGSPFVSTVFGLDKVLVTSLTKEVPVNKAAILEFDAKDTGTGEPVVVVNDGRVPCEVKKIDQRKYRASFIPKSPGSYYVEVKLYDQEIPESPFKVKAYDASKVSTTIGLVRGVVQTPIKFDVNTSPHKGNLKVQVSSPTKKPTQAKIIKVDDMNYSVEFLPMETGNYDVTVTFEDHPVHGSPFVIPVANPGGVLITMKSKSLILGQVFNMSVDTSRAGPGDLGVKANSPVGPIPLEGSLVGNGLYSVSFIPPVPGQYFVDVSFDGKPLPESPIVLSVNDIGNVILSVGDSPLCRVGQSRQIHVCTNCAGCAELQAKLTPPGNQTTPLVIGGSSQAGFDISFVPKVTGPHKVDITYGGVTVPGSPVVFMCYDASKIKVLGVTDGVVGKKSAFTIDLNDSGEGELEVVVMSAAGKPVANEVSAIRPGRLEVSYVPMEGGPHIVEITFNKENVQGGPFKFKVRDPNKINVRGDGIESVPVNTPALFYIVADEAAVSDFDIQIRGPPKSRQIIPLVNNFGANQVKVEYTAKTVGEYEVHVVYQGVPIQNSPFYVKVWDASRVQLSRIGLGQVGVESSFNVEMKDAGDGTVEISIVDPTGQLIPNHVSSKCPGILEVRFVPQVSGIHNILVDFNSVKVNGTPRQFQVVDANKVSVKGEGLGLVPCRALTSFTVVAPDAMLKDIDVKITDPMGQELFPNISERGGSFRVDYTPVVAGPHKIDVIYFGSLVKGSPFVSRVWDVSKAMLSSVSLAQVGEKSKFDVIVSEAGEGVCEISITDPNGQLVPNQVASTEPGVLTVMFTPTTYGYHKGSVLFNKQSIPGTPFNFVVVDRSKVTCSGIGTGFIPVNKLTSITMEAPMAEKKDIDVKIIGPRDVEVPCTVYESGSNNFKIDFTPTVAGTYGTAVRYFNQPVLACELKAWDPSKVLVGSIPLGRVSHENVFNVDVREAGEGRLEISIKNPAGQMIENSVTPQNKRPGLYLVSCLPQVSGLHDVSINFNGEHLAGSPFPMNVCDPKLASVTGEGLHFVRCNRPTSFELTGPAALVEDVHVSIRSPGRKEMKVKLRSITNGKFQVEYTPQEPGEYIISVRYFDEPVKDSPFVAVAWNPSLVTVDSIQPGILGRPNSFHVNAAEAGPGNLEVLITSQGEIIKNTARTIQNTGLVEVSYVPISHNPHVINVKFNGEPVPGSPFTALVLNGCLARATGPGLGRVIAGLPTSFAVQANAVGSAADVDVMLTSSSGQYVPVVISGSYATGFVVEYIPVEAGQHLLTVKYADCDIKDSPFHPDVFDPGNVSVSNIPVGCIDKPLSFKVDASSAGPGKTSVLVQGQRTRPHVDISTDSNGISLVSFTPSEGVIHNIAVRYNDIDVQGSPFKCTVIDQKKMKVQWDSLSIKPVGRPVQLQLDTSTSPNLPISCTVLDPFANGVLVTEQRTGTVYNAQFIPDSVGDYTITLFYGDEVVPGSPFTCSTYDLNFVRILDVTPGGTIGQEISFAVDTRDAGPGRVDASVTCDGSSVPMRQDKQAYKQRFMFVPRSPSDYIIDVFFNNEQVPGTPFAYQIINPANNLTLVSGNNSQYVAVGQVVWAVITAPTGIPISVGDCDAQVTGPYSDQLVPARLMTLPNGNVKAEYIPSVCGPHSLSVMYAGQLIPGSPVVTEVFDPNKVFLEGMPTGEVGKPMIINILREGAGTADLNIKIISPSGNETPFEVDSMGEEIAYVPSEPGWYKINVTYGGLNVPGCPVRQEIKAILPVTATGDGLFKGVVGRPASFLVDSKGQAGQLSIQIQGATGVLESTYEQQSCNLYKVTYVPVEVGVHSISILFNGKQVPGLFKPKISNPANVTIMDNWEAWPQEDQVVVRPERIASIYFDTTQAGPGELTATIEGPVGQSKIIPDVLPAEGGCFLKFVPRVIGNYIIRVYYNGMPTPVFPIVAVCCPEQVDVIVDLPPADNACCAEKTVSKYEGRPRSPPCPCQAMNDQVTAEKLSIVKAEPPQKMVSFGEVQEIGDKMPQISDPSTAGWMVPQYPIMPYVLPAAVQPDQIQYGGNVQLTGYPQFQPVIIQEEYKFEDDDTAPVAARPYPYEIDASRLKSNMYHDGPEFLIMNSPAPEKQTTTSSSQTMAIDSQSTQTDDPPQENKLIELIEIVPPPSPPPVYDTDFVLLPFDANQPIPEQLHSHDGDIILIQQSCPPQPQPPPQPQLPPQPQPPAIIPQAEAKIDENLVVISGPGLSIARCREQACFVIDGKDAGPGRPTVRMIGLKEEVNVDVEEIDHQLYGCSYVPPVAGSYLLTILWNGRQIPSSPIKITVLPCCDPKQAVLFADCLRQAQLSQETSVAVDCRRAGYGNLTAFVQGPSKLYHCEVDNRNDGTYEVSFKPQEIGNYILNVMFDEEHIPGSPFAFKVGANPDASKVRVSGEGLKNGMLATFDSKFTVDTRGAGPGQLNVKVRGKKGTFQVEMVREPRNERVVLCKFNPNEVGEYYVNVLWSGEHAPGSPFKVVIVDTLQELRALQSGGKAQLSNLYYGTMSSEPGANFMFSDD